MAAKRQIGNPWPLKGDADDFIPGACPAPRRFWGTGMRLSSLVPVLVNDSHIRIVTLELHSIFIASFTNIV